MTIHLILGRQGSGKTLLLVKLAYEYLKFGKTVYSNVHLNMNYKPINYNDIVACNLMDAVVLIDEVHLLLPSRRALSRLNTEICDNFLSMARKQNTEIFGSTQTLRKVDVRFREEADYIYQCTKYVYNENTNTWVEALHTHIFDDSVPILIEVEVTETYSLEQKTIIFLGNEYFNMFDTRQVIKIEGLPDKYKR